MTKNWIQYNWLKLIIAVWVLLVTVAVGYYFIIISPREYTEQQKLLVKETMAQNSQSCEVSGLVFYQNFQAKETKAGINIGLEPNSTIWGDPTYHFNNKLNTCLIFLEFSEQDTFDEVYDVNSDKLLLRKTTQLLGPFVDGFSYDQGHISESSFVVEYNQLMSQ